MVVYRMYQVYFSRPYDTRKYGHCCSRMEPPPERQGEAMKIDDEYWNKIIDAFTDCPDEAAFLLICKRIARDTAARCVEIAQQPFYGGPGINIAEVIHKEFQL